MIAVFYCTTSSDDKKFVENCYETILANEKMDIYLYFLTAYFLYEYDQELFKKHKYAFTQYMHKNIGSNWKQENAFNDNIYSIIYDITRDDNLRLRIKEFLAFATK